MSDSDFDSGFGSDSDFSDTDTVDNYDYSTFGTTAMFDSSVVAAHTCTHCHKSMKNSYMRNGFEVCVECGFSSGLEVDQAGEWNNYDGNADKSRVGHVDNLIFQTSNLSTSARGAMGKLLQHGSITHKDADMMHMNQLFTQIAEQKCLPNCVVIDTCIIYRKVTELSTIRQSNRVGVMAAAFYQAVSKVTKCYNITDIARWFNVDSQIVSSGNNRINGLSRKGMGAVSSTSSSVSTSSTSSSSLVSTPASTAANVAAAAAITVVNRNVVSVRITKASDFVDKFSNFLFLEQSDKFIAKQISLTVETHSDFYGTRGTSLAAGIIFYTLCKPNKNRESLTVIPVSEIVLKTKVSEGTIKKMFKKIKTVHEC